MSYFKKWKIWSNHEEWKLLSKLHWNRVRAICFLNPNSCWGCSNIRHSLIPYLIKHVFSYHLNYRVYKTWSDRNQPEVDAVQFFLILNGSYITLGVFTVEQNTIGSVYFSILSNYGNSRHIISKVNLNSFPHGTKFCRLPNIKLVYRHFLHARGKRPEE